MKRAAITKNDSNSLSSSYASNVKRKSNAPTVPLNSVYPHRLNLYHIPPNGDVSIEEFESFALDRLQVLKAIETAQIRNKSEEELTVALQPILSKYLPLNGGGDERITRVIELDRQRRKDHISHFILRLAYARSEDLRNWFLRQECMLFKLRFNSADVSERHAFLKDSKVNITPITEEEKQQLRDDLIRVTWFQKGKSFDTEPFYKVRFEDALELIGQRQVIVKDGFAYVAAQDQVVLLVNEFRAHLLVSLENAAKFLPRMDEDERLVPVLNNMSKQYLGQNQFTDAAVAGKVSADDIPKLVQHYPLCMKQLHTRLADDNHLRHGGRMQYGLFLKGMGMPLEEALVFWRRMFAKMTDDQFQKGYAYNIRHNYGMEGKRANYTPYSCIKIITSNHPSTGDHHGCPFRHFSPDNLRSTLSHHGCAESTVTEMMNLVKNGHYQVACTRFFEVTRGKKVGAVNPAHLGNESNSQGEISGSQQQSEIVDMVMHPNQFFEMSFKGVPSTASQKVKNGSSQSQSDSNMETDELDR
ncbi:eukaryotic and archaeal DNA primase, large subunit-domain-containing protein [Paraphysoderma sedebokerense]|nr:eukaryotic and archaeal DNA primase, large subunit-domain-containing protein [Paraphysoderma sedebokerense]